MRFRCQSVLRKGAFFFLLIGVLVFTAYQLTYCQTRKVLLSYLQTNKLDLATQNPDWTTVWDESFYQNQIFLIGERHGIAYSYEALWLMFKQIKAKTNFTYYLLEAPLYWETYLNQYLDTGNETFLKKPFLEAKGTFYANQNFYNFYKKLYSYNQALPAQDRIRFISLDVEHQFRYSHAQLLSLFDQHVKIHPDTCRFIRLFYHLNPEKTGNYQKAYQQYQQAFAQDSLQLQQELGSAYETTHYLIRNINYKFIATADKHDLARDSLMYENFKTRTRTMDLQAHRAFGFMGIDHCYLEGAKRAKYFAAYLPKQRYKVASTIMLYSECSTRIPSFYLPKPLRFLGGKKGYFLTKLRSNDGWIEHQKYMDVLKEVSPSCMTLFRLTGSQSPFKERHLLVDELKSAAPTTAYMQYVVLIRNSPAADALEFN
ncbi:hypothetical protein [Siphonobacter sp. SORGH_AS_1065]|uniref:hypothetical protein n=1 Tax=Siphonobacter sp. SORGH_AS_1065 TaxID=3041795 RepID=UPI002780E5E3|nr:hypothetical protein [Siphonobacter sp. SORGH_AS_1065]MDQ1090553.1 hypothetical protein [Siphonobacter sp. SORGH_AS_1065]